MTNTAPELLVGASSDFLKRFSPFDRMEADALAFVAQRAVLGFHARGSEVLTPEMGLPRHFYIVQRGKVQARQTAAGETSSLTLGPGECFPIGALSAQRPSTNAYVALEDSFVYQLAADDFIELMRISPVFHLFCTQYIASLLSQSRQQLQSTFAQRAAEQQTMTTPLGDLVKQAPVWVAPETSTRAALEKMAELRIGCMVVCDDAQQPVGILTQSDLLPRVVLPAFNLARPIAEIMTPAPRTLPASASAYDAALDMATHGVRHLLVIDGEGRLAGVVSERDLFSLQRISLRQIRASIETAADIEALQRAATDIRQLALNLIAQGIGAEQLTRFISALNDALTHRIIALALERHDLYGIDYAWLAFGSEGRHEQTLSTDQDNGLVFVCPELVDKEQLKLRLLEFARDVNDDLAACGFPLCKGNIMASNPELCLTPEEWRHRFGKWISEPDPQALLNASIFFDFRVLYGNQRLGDQLRAWLNKTAKANSAFRRMMAVNALQVAPPLGRLRDFVVEDDGTIDLKKSGARLFVDAARIFALHTGVGASGTVQRLRQSAVKMGFPQDEVAAIVDGFHFIQLLRLRSQHLETEHDEPGDNKVHPDALNELDRRILKEAFRQARKLQSRLRLDYQI
ncbi:CBS domain-containing protein [Thauera sp. CAU 1555]|uniref:CBS domain-containing protein n=1 Tax=Thauera sedimentorum TaxID=2767595 RepID=A0ABR9BAH0_9RHOO|nr:DUF294 nucleotidyltransferase-like domain-containing protein [Thauera sedimentorum]MBC9072035.1 CBS domain-containing protein [Thauera sedimentorum]MBD8502954.1 CBS domain-containing protein [Thauera sedimentorum]